jgi:putative glutamine amidotransferase
MARKPLIGITTYVEPAAWGHWDREAALVPYDYVRAVERAGGRAVLVPPDDGGNEEILDALDGLVLSGGNDMEPEGYGADSHPATVGTNPERDRGELALLEAAIEHDLPVLAICRGVQVLNVARGGDIVQHLPEVVGHEEHREIVGEFSEHAVRVDPSSRIREVHGPVKSHHHQALGRIGDGLREDAWAEDGTVEGVEDPDKPFLVGVLWHPEAGEDQRLFEQLVEAAQTSSSRNPN